MKKKCSHCQQEKELPEFRPDPRYKLEIRSWCKKCESKSQSLRQKKSAVRKSEYMKEYRKKNAEKIKLYKKEYRQKHKNDPYFKLTKNLRERIRKVIKRQKTRKRNKSLNLIGCSVNFLMGYLEALFSSGMTWENYGEWHVDHIKPCASFDLKNEEEQRACFHYTNLQPLWAKDNILKSDNLNYFF